MNTKLANPARQAHPNGRHVSRDEARRPRCRRTMPKGKIAILRAEHPPVHFYRYLYNTIGRAISLGRPQEGLAMRRWPRSFKHPQVELMSCMPTAARPAWRNSISAKTASATSPISG